MAEVALALERRELGADGRRTPVDVARSSAIAAEPTGLPDSRYAADDEVEDPLLTLA